MQKNWASNWKSLVSIMGMDESRFFHKGKVQQLAKF